MERIPYIYFLFKRFCCFGLMILSCDLPNMNGLMDCKRAPGVLFLWEKAEWYISALV